MCYKCTYHHLAMAIRLIEDTPPAEVGRQGVLRTRLDAIKESYDREMLEVTECLDSLCLEVNVETVDIVRAKFIIVDAVLDNLSARMFNAIEEYDQDPEGSSSIYEVPLPILEESGSTKRPLEEEDNEAFNGRVAKVLKETDTGEDGGEQTETGGGCADIEVITLEDCTEVEVITVRDPVEMDRGSDNDIGPVVIEGELEEDEDDRTDTGKTNEKDEDTKDDANAGDDKDTGNDEDAKTDVDAGNDKDAGGDEDAGEDKDAKNDVDTRHDEDAGNDKDAGGDEDAKTGVDTGKDRSKVKSRGRKPKTPKDPKSGSRVGFVPCLRCQRCLAKDCGTCAPCLNKKKQKRRCNQRTCGNMLTRQERDELASWEQEARAGKGPISSPPFVVVNTFKFSRRRCGSCEGCEAKRRGLYCGDCLECSSKKRSPLVKRHRVYSCQRCSGSPPQ